MMALSSAGCAEFELGAPNSSGDPGAQGQTSEAPVPQRLTRRELENIDPSMRPDPEVFLATELGLWDGERTLPGVWVAHPAAEIARRVRLTNDETGAQADAAMFRRDSNSLGPRVIVSSEAAEWLGLTPGHATPMTIEGLTYRTDTKAAGEAAGPAEEAEEPPSGSSEVPVAEVVVEPIVPETEPLSAESAETPKAVEPTANGDLSDSATGEDVTGEDAPEPGPEQDASISRPVWEEAEPDASPPATEPVATPIDPAPDVTGEITDGRHFIQAGIFGQPENAARLTEKLRAANLPVDQIPLVLGDRQLTRVLIGPYRSVAERDLALQTVKQVGPKDATPARGPARG